MSVPLLATGSLAAAALVLAACSSSGSGGSTTPPPSTGGKVSPGASSVALAVGSTRKGMVLTDNGRTLYTFAPDTSTSSACTGACASTWPPVTGTAAAGGGLPASDFGTISRPDGTKQVTYLGHPVYEFSGDKAAGDVNGDGIQGIWHVAKVAGGGGTSTPAPSTSTSSSGSGYNY